MVFVINGQEVTYVTICDVARRGMKVKLGRSAEQKVSRTREAIENAVAEGRIIYGVTTGFGAFKTTAISQKETKKLQENLIRSHAVGVGDALPTEVVRGMMFIMVNYLSKGHSGVRGAVVETLIEMLNKGVHPLVPEKGSVGSSGDLAPSAHVILVAIGSGEAEFRGKKCSGKRALTLAGIRPLELQSKEGLALINNTSCMSSIAALNLEDAHALMDAADANGALAAEALRATAAAFDDRVHNIKPHKGQRQVALSLRRLTTGSTMMDNTRIQDQYSIRCIPQIHGAVREAVEYVERVVTTELNSVTDNPLIFHDDGDVDVISGGNFHGEPVAIAMDTLGIAMSELANIADRRAASLVDPATSFGLPAFLAENGGLNSGFMILQYTTAALVSENKVLAHPSSVDSVPTSANVEDLVSMGTIGSRKAREIIGNVRNVLAIERMIACQAIDFRLDEGYKLGKGTKILYAAARKLVPHFKNDAVYYEYFKKLAESL